MIVADTHVWVWWVHGDNRLSASQMRTLNDQEAFGIGISAISCWEVAKLVELGRLSLPRPIDEWMTLAVGYPGIEILALTPEIAVRSTALGDSLPKDPADQIIVATAAQLECPLVTSDSRIAHLGVVEVIA